VYRVAACAANGTVYAEVVGSPRNCRQLAVLDRKNRVFKSIPFAIPGHLLTAEGDDLIVALEDHPSNGVLWLRLPRVEH
jgi:hypothetical protein